MTALIVIGSVLLLLGILLFSPLILRFAYQNGKHKASVRYLFIKLDFSPEEIEKRAEKKAKRAVKKEYEKQKEEEKTKDKKKEAAADTVKTVWSLLKSCKKGINTIRNHLIIYKVRAAIVVGGDDAHKIATGYANLCTLLSNGIALLDLLFVMEEPEIEINPDFILEKTKWDISFRVRILPWYVISAALGILISFLKVIRVNKQKRQKIKGGKQHEPTASY